MAGGYLSKSQFIPFMVNARTVIFWIRSQYKILELEQGNLYRYAGNYGYFWKKIS